MLKMKCLACEKDIVSPLLAELKQITCPVCGEDVPVKDIIVYANGFSYDRTQLRGQLYRYKELLNAARHDYEKLKNSPTANAKSTASSKQFVATLQEIMTGAKNSCRVSMLRDYFVMYKSNGFKGFALVFNLSMDGICLQATTKEALPGTNKDITISLSLPGTPKPLTIHGRVVWSRLPGDSLPTQFVGIQFLPLDSMTQKLLWRFIEETSTQIARKL